MRPRILFAFALFLLTAASSFAATGGVLLQSAKSHNTIATVAPAFPQAVGLGDLIVACYQWQSNTVTRSSVTDSIGADTYSFVTLASNTTNNYQSECAYTTVANFRSSLTVTVTFSAAVVSDAIISEWSGVGAVDPGGSSSCTNFTAATTSPTCTATTTNANDLVLEFFAGTNSTDVFTAGGSFTSIQTQQVTFLAYKTVSSAGSQAAAVTSSNSDNFSTLVLTFQQTTATSWVRQIRSQSGSAVTSLGCTPLTNVAAGSLLVANVLWNQNSGVTVTASDSLNGAWTPVSSAAVETTGPTSEQMFYFPNSAAGAVTVTFTTSPATSSNIWCVFTEYVGMATSSPIDGTPVTNSLNVASTTMVIPSAGSMATSNANDVVVGGCAPSTSITVTADTGYTTRVTGTQVSMQDQFTTTTGNFTVTCKTGSNNWAGTLAAFKQAPTVRRIVHRVTQNN